MAALPKSAQPAARAALAEIYNAEDKTHARAAAKAFAAEFGVKWPKAAAKITDDLDVLLAFFDYPAEHWIHLRTTNPIWVFYSRGWSGRCFPDQSWKRPALTLNAIDPSGLSWIRSVGPAAQAGGCAPWLEESLPASTQICRRRVPPLLMIG